VTASGARSHDGGGGIPIGISEDARYRNEIIALSPGDRVVFYTDGATEAANDEDEEFGVDRLLACLSEPSEGGIRAQLRRLNAQIQEFTKPGRLRDDVTMVGLGLE
ncbi:MAG: PP2C family protein-serine/threonine phosphatase, partial [Myxococcota bacterium]